MGEYGGGGDFVEVRVLSRGMIWIGLDWNEDIGQVRVMVWPLACPADGNYYWVV